MGNSAGGFRFQPNVECTYNFQLGKSATINMKGGEIKREDNGKRSQTWEVSYNVAGLTCTLSLKKTTARNSDDIEELEIKIKDNMSREKINHEGIKESSTVLRSRVQGGEAGLAGGAPLCSQESSETFRNNSNYSSSTFFPYTKTTTNSWGSVTHTTFCPYGWGTRKRLYVSQCKKKKKGINENVTIAHYYANSDSGENYYTSRIDIGLSMVVNIRMSANCGFGFDFTVDGPLQHPSSALFYMFEEVERTWMWNPTACPHCAKIQRQSRRILWWQSESESEDNDGLIGAAPAHDHGSKQIARNNGRFVGDGNGSNYERNIMFFIKKFLT